MLVENFVSFGRVLRRLGLSAGTDALLSSLKVIERLGLEDREAVYWGLHAIYVHRAEESELFRAAFQRFFRDPAMASALSQLLPPAAGDRASAPKRAGATRVREALRGRLPSAPSDAPADESRIEFDAALSYSDREVLRTKDFEQMTAAELDAVKAALRKVRFVTPERPTRRTRTHSRGRRFDGRRTLRESLRTGGDPMVLARKTPRTRPPPLVVLCDVSGSMERYSRMFLHLVHALTNDRDRVHTFLFGTRLSHVTRWLGHRDPDEALQRVGREVQDWSGGTRIGSCLRTFNRDWSRRVLGQGAWVLLVTDGLDRDREVDLSFEVARLKRSCRRLIWLNPLLRYARFEPRAAGIRAILPHVDEFRPVHDLSSLDQLARALAEAPRV
jgi:hypothetical protein